MAWVQRMNNIRNTAEEIVSAGAMNNIRARAEAIIREELIFV